MMVVVSDCDYNEVSKWCWSLDKQGYAKRSIGKNKSISMHQQIMGKNDGYEIDHIDKDKRNNTRENLRWVTRSQNNLNRNVDPRSKTGHNGINKCKTGSYRVRLSHKELGRYKTLEEAISVRQRAVSDSFQNTETNL